MFCINCGKDIEDFDFCPYCGKAQKRDTSNTSTDANHKNSSGFDFHNWCIGNDLESIEKQLKNQDLDTKDVLVSLSESDVDKLLFLSFGAKKKLITAVQKLKNEEGLNISSQTSQYSDEDSIPGRCPNCGEIWGKAEETSGAGSTLGKALLGGLLLGPLGMIGGAAFGNKKIVYFCPKCGFKREYKSSLVKNITKQLK